MIKETSHIMDAEDLRSIRALLLVLSLSLSPLLAQNTLPPGSIDGAVNPEGIPDVAAFRLFLGALVDQSAAPAVSPEGGSSLPLQPSASQRRKLLPVGLNSTDTGLLLQALQAWHGDMSAASSATDASAPAIDLDSIAQRALNGLKQRMSAAGFAQLLAHIRAEKKHMTRIPVPDMSGGRH